MLVRSRCLFPVAEEPTNGIIDSIPSDARSRCSDAKVAHGTDGSGKVRRQAVSGRIFLLRSVFSPKTLPLPTIRSKGIRQRKQATDGKSEDKEKERLTDEAES